MDKYSYISNADVGYIDELYKSYKENPENVDESWRKFFEGFEFSQQRYGDGGPSEEIIAGSKEIKVRNFIYAHRSRAHLKSDTNPVRQRRTHNVRLELSNFDLSEADLNETFEVGSEIGLPNATLNEIRDRLARIYLGHIGYEYNHLRNSDIFDWMKTKVETEGVDVNPSDEEKTRILSKLNEAVVFENFLHTKFLGQKRFSLEGGENTIPALDKIIRRSSELGAEEVVIGMAHRGRLNVLANIMGKTYEEIFAEFEGSTDPDLTMGDGDVKYHLGYSSHLQANGKKIYVKLAPNPSHLEAVDPVVLGYSRAQIDDEYRGDMKKVVPILIHGDAAIAGQGLVYECIQMSLLDGYRSGGTIHFVINNQVGFTTDYDDARSSIYCTDLAKIIDAPVVHVNGDDPEAVNFAANLAVEYRQKFNKDFFIDLLCYRRHGHNESDEPKFTQPKLYNLIAKHPNPREVYVKQLIERKDISPDRAETLDKEFKQQLQDRLDEVKQKPLPYKPQKIEEEWHFLRRSKPEDFDKSPETGISDEVLKKVSKALTTIPKGFKPLRQIDKLLKERKSHFFEEKMLNWADAELLAYGSLLAEGNIVRMSGQDVKRGTFSHRHSYLFDSNTNEPYCNLDHIQEKQEPFRIFNSLLSEYAVLGFEYGYAMATPNALVIWEAQFGDFSNGAQVMIDQFITSAETKWQRMNGLVMLLPHGYEGQGPEHSSARMERFLQMTAQENMIVADVTTPANLFHLVRRQLTWEFRKPCVVFSPKSLLRHPKVVSPLEEFTKGNFQEVIGDDYVTNKSVKKVLLCTGKVYFDLQEEQQKKKVKDVAIVRLEQLYPFPKKQLEAVLKKYNNPQLVWVQEEPENMGAWGFMLRISGLTLKLVARKPMASPATGYSKVHKREQAEIVNKAFEI
ncbi:2-oxoglutarate dehydrogenase E1 component [Marinoscillum sp. 108]|uniref:2-oxoglutarate dehydrogenase E1 component n=1 Tax=Marinoscillum sp. 108 TaxID=2653151 RepID=UPI0012F265DE|nr:2-oxoglutarate dehydrogenase E1 component [Marinoscillum sp. 108]VXD19726.1 2-oxoglutarate decarboxylase, thiamin-requiring [Marinoscillum sp. 108]